MKEENNIRTIKTEGIMIKGTVIVTMDEGSGIRFCINCGNDIQKFGKQKIIEGIMKVECRCGCRMDAGTFSFID
jgi:hypothetical protein